MNKQTKTRFDVAIVGTGYVGLTTGACFAKLGHRVICADIDESKVEHLNEGHIPILEDGLAEIVAAAREQGSLKFVVGAAQAAEVADIVFLCVPTPQSEDGSADLSYVEAAAAEVAPVLASGAVIVNKSTVPVGSTVVVERALGRDDVSVVSNPEFLREGTAVSDFLNPDRIVIGGRSSEAIEKVAALYAKLDAPIVRTDPASAETIKYAANGFLAIKISFANEVAALCEAVGADVRSVTEGIGYDDRIGNRFLQPGPGWGGSCFPKDSRALVSIAAQHGYEFTLMQGAVSVNIEQRERLVRKIAMAAGRESTGVHPLDGIVVAVLGLTFKASTDDMRESPSLDVVRRLHALGATVQAYDPTTVGELSAVQVGRLGSLIPQPSVDFAVQGADVLAVLTEWPEFGEIDFDDLRGRMRGRGVVDGRNLLDSVKVRSAGFNYWGVGRT